MRLSELFSAEIDGMSYNGFITIVNNLYPLRATWSSAIDLNSLDRYILVNLGKRKLYEYFAEKDSKLVYHYIYDILKANEYKLNGLYDSTQHSDEYNPIENYDRYENSKTNNGARKSTTSNGKRETQTDYGSATDKSTTVNSDTAFDSSPDYSNATSKSINDIIAGAHTDKTTSEAVSDTISTDAAEDRFESHIHGNIGVVSSMKLLEEQRAVVDYVFYNEILYIIQSTILSDCMWFDED